MTPAIQPFSVSPVVVSCPEISTPKSASQKNSGERKESANSPSTGATTASATIPIIPPRKDAEVASPIARPACPLRASGKPSSVVAALAGVPGMLSRIAERDPP